MIGADANETVIETIRNTKSTIAVISTSYGYAIAIGENYCHKQEAIWHHIIMHK